MKKSFYIITIVFLSLTACKNGPTKEEQALNEQIESYDALMTEAIEIHDEIMPKMGQLMELKGELKEKYAVFNDSIVANDGAEKAELVSMNLKKAHDDMMSWMQDYSEKFPYGEPSPETKYDLDQKIPVLVEEVNEIETLKERTMTAIKNAQVLLNK